MKSPSPTTLTTSKQIKLLPASAATKTQWKHKITSIYTDDKLQSTDARRRYMRRGSKTPTMLLVEASRELDLLGESLFPKIDAQQSDITNISYHALSSKALALASAIDVLPDSYLVDCRIKRRSNPWTCNKNSAMLNSSPEAKTNQSVFAISRGDDSLKGKDKAANHYIQPRRLSAMTALKQHLEKASISNTPASSILQIQDD